MEDTITTFETARLAKEKGLISGIKCPGVYCIGFLEMEPDPDKLWTKSAPRSSVKNQPHLALAPTQQSLQNWLRDNYSIEAFFIYWPSRIQEYFDHKPYESIHIKQQVVNYSEYFETAYNALENALYQALINIEN